MVDNFSRKWFPEKVLSFHKLGKLKTFFLTLLVFVGLVGLFSFQSPVQAVSGNLVTVNKGFEQNNLTGWTKTTGWSVQSTTIHGGTKAAICTYSGTSCGDLRTDFYSSITAGDTVQFSVWVYMSNGQGNFVLKPNWTVSGATFLGNPTIATFTGNQWRQLVINTIAPVNATAFSLQIIASDVTGSYYVDDAAVYNYGQDDLDFQYQEMTDNHDTQIGVEGWVTGRDRGYSDWLDSTSTIQKLVRVKVFADDGDSIRENGNEGFLQSDLPLKVEKCSATHTNVDKLTCSDWSDATVYYGYTDSSGGAVFNVKDNREVRVTLLSPLDGSIMVQVEGIMRGASGLFAIPFSGFHDFVGIIRSVADGTCDSTIGSHPCYKMYTGSGFVWIKAATGSLSTYVDHRVYVYLEDALKGPSGTFYFSVNPGSVNGLKASDTTAKFGLGGGDIDTTTFGGTGGVWEQLNTKAIYPSASWASIEPNAPVNGVHTYNWSTTDDLYKGMDYCDSKGWSCPIELIYDMPAWVMTGTRTVCGSDVDGVNYNVGLTHFADLKAFAKAVAERYDGDNDTLGPGGTSLDAPNHPIAHSISFLNEPDIKANCTPTDYAAQFKEVADGVHEAGGKVSTAGFALENDAYKNGGDPTHSTTWVETFLTSSEADLADYVNIHWYQFFKELVANKWNGSWLYWYDWDSYAYGGIRGKLNYVYDVMRSTSLDRPIVIGEVGSYWEDDHLSNPPNIDNLLQARILFKEFSELGSTNLTISHALWFKLVGTTGHYPGYGLIVNGYQRLSYTAYKTIATQLTGLKFLEVDHDTNVEGYKYMNGSNGIKEVLWVGNCGNPSSPNSCPTSQSKTFSVTTNSTVTIYNTAGTTTTYCDGTGGGCDGIADGLVKVTLSTYLDTVPNPDRNVGIPVIASYTPNP